MVPRDRVHKTTRAIAIVLSLAAGLGCAGSRPVPANPTAARALRSQARTAYGAKDYKGCADLYTRSVAADPGAAAEDHYDHACCLALAGDRDGALATLDQAVKAGFGNRAHLERDTDLASLHADARWAALVTRVQSNAEAVYRDANAELRKIHDEDQADRAPGPSGINWAEVTPRDVARRARVNEILAAGGAKVAIDYFHAAMVFQHGNEVADYQKSHELALRAAELDPRLKRARWLAAASKDRELMNLGKPQLYGTQFRKVDGRWELYQTDPSITDEERARWNVPPIAEAQGRVEQMNAAR